MNTIFLSTSSSSPLTLTQTVASLHLPSPKPRSKRPNYLRRKIPKTLTLTPTPTPIPSPPTPPPDNASPIEDATQIAAFDTQYVEQVVDVGIKPPAHRSWLPEGIAGFALRLVALIAVQTAVAVWIYGRANGGSEEEVKKGQEVSKGAIKEERRVLGMSTEAPQFEAKVLEIRAMAREVRENERRAVDDDSGEEMEVLLKGKARIDLSRKMDDLRVVSDQLDYVKNGNVDGKTNGSDAREKERRGINGVSGGESDVLLEGKSELDSSRKIADRIGGKKNDNVVGKTKRRRMDYRRKMSYLNSMAKINAAPKGFSSSKFSGGAKQIQNGSSMDDVVLLHQPTESKAKMDGIVVSSSHIASENTNSCLETNVNSIDDAIGNEVETEKSFKANNSSSNSGSSQGQRSMNENIRNAVNCRNSPAIKKDHQCHAKEDDASLTKAKVKPWWLKLPYVLAILLYRGVKKEDPRGLYSLQPGGSPEAANAESYTVVFQDRGDATNFCYLVESFFEDLSNVSADIIPMTIEELYKAVESRELNVLVVGKGQLNLYAGQPLTEVESVLRSLVY